MLRLFVVLLLVSRVVALEDYDDVVPRIASSLGTIVISTIDGQLRALNTGTGDTRWTIQGDPVLRAPRTVKQGFTFLPNPQDGSLYTLKEGILKRLPLNIPALVHASPLKSTDGVLYAGSKKDIWLEIDPLTGSKVETLSASSDKVCPVKHHNGVFVGRTEYRITMFDTKNRGKTWNTTFSDYSAHLLPANNDYPYRHYVSHGNIVTVGSQEDLMMQARKIKYDVIGLTETRRHRPLHAVFETGEELFLGTCDSRGVGGVGVLVNTHLAMNIDSWTWESPGGQFHNEIDHIIFNRRFCLTDVAVVPKFYTGSDHRLLRARFRFSVREERAMKFRKRSPKTSINWDHFASLASKWEDSVIDNIDEEYNRLVEHLHDSATKAESLQEAKRRLSSKTLELIRQRGIARATGNYQQTSGLAKLCREAIKEDLKERRAAVMDEAAEAGRSIRKARRSFANYKTKMTSLRRPNGTVTAPRRAMEKVIYDFYSDLFDSHVYLPTHHLRQDEYIAPSVPRYDTPSRR
nr:Craniofacial development protein 2 [Haemonchus contortus]